MLRRRVMGKGNPLSGKKPAQIACDLEALEYIIRSNALSKKWEPLLQGYAEDIKRTLKSKYRMSSNGCMDEYLVQEYYNGVESYNAWLVDFPLDAWSPDWNTNYSYRYFAESMLTGKSIKYKTGVTFRGVKFSGTMTYDTRKLEFNRIYVDK